MDASTHSLTASTLWNLEALSVAPEFRWLETANPIRSLLYQGLPYEGHLAEVFAWYVSPLTIGAVKNCPAERFPAIVLIHGGGGTAIAEWVYLWAQRGYAAIAMDLGGQQPADQTCGPIAGEFSREVTNDVTQRTPLQNGGPNQSLDDKFASVDREAEHHWSRHAVANVILAHSLIRSFPEVDAARTAVTGISWGGYTTCLVASVDSRFQAAVPIYGCGFLYEGESNQKPEIDKLAPASREKWIALYDPSRHLPACRVPLFFVNGTHDPHYPLDSHARTVALPSGPVTVRIEPHMVHSHEHGWAPEEIGLFIDSYCRPGSLALPRLAAPEVNAETIRVPYTAAVPLKSAALHYTTDEGPRTDRQWRRIEAAVAADLIIAPALPSGTNTWFINAIDARGAMVSTAPKLIESS